MKKTIVLTALAAIALCAAAIAAQNDDSTAQKAKPAEQNAAPPPQSTSPSGQDTADALRSRFRAVGFNYKSSTLSPFSYDALDSVAAILKQDEYKRYEIQGYSDSVGPPTYNRLLSGARAGAVKEYLVSKGVHEVNIIAIGYGKKKPKASNKTEEGRAANRRVEIQEIDSWDKFYALKNDEAKQREKIIDSHFKWEGKPQPAKPEPKPAAEPESKTEPEKKEAEPAKTGQ